MAESVSSRDLRAMMDLIRDGYADEPAEGLPAAVGAGLSRLVRCDSICLFELSPGHRHCTGDGCVHDPGLSPVFWTHYWSCPPCSYPERSGDYKSVTKTSDFYSQRQWHSAPMYSAYLRRFGVEDEIVACLPARPAWADPCACSCAVTAAASPNGTSSWSNCCAPTCTLSTSFTCEHDAGSVVWPRSRHCRAGGVWRGRHGCGLAGRSPRHGDGT